jgi:hypothetical protein
MTSQRNMSWTEPIQNNGQTKNCKNTMVEKTVHGKLKIDQHALHWKQGLNTQTKQSNTLVDTICDSYIHQNNCDQPKHVL